MVQQGADRTVAKELDNNNNNEDDDTSLLWVRTEPHVQDPRELHTILTCSLRSLWGQWEPYSGSLQVEVDSSDSSKLLIVQCPRAYVRQVQAALTMVTLPEYMEDDNSVVYQMDVVKIQPTAAHN